VNLPFTTEQFFEVFEQYNRTVWPYQIVSNLLALVALISAIKHYSCSNRVISAILTLLWLWVGIVYHLHFFAPINPAANIFGPLFILQGLIFAYYGVLQPRLKFHYCTNIYGIAGGVLIMYALLIYPLLGSVFGHVYPKSPTFGLPCPTTIFTFGLLLWTGSKLPKSVLAIPFIWSLIGSAAAFTMGVREDVGLLVAGVACTTLVIIRDRKSATTENSAGNAVSD
jgi:hypothetical protein